MAQGGSEVSKITNSKSSLYSSLYGILITGVIVMAAPPALSAIWFPPHQRTTSTSISQVSTQIGLGLSFGLGPLIVPEHNLTSIEEVKDSIHSYLWIEAGMSLILFVAILIYYPKEPLSPPSATASIPRTEFKQGLKFLLKDRNAILCTLAFGLSGGIFLAWQVRGSIFLTF